MKGTREVTAFIGIPLALGAIVFLPAWVFLALIWAIALLAAHELLAMLRQRGDTTPLWPTLAALGVALPALWIGLLPAAGVIFAALILLLPLIVLLSGHPIPGVATAITGSVFTASYFAVTAGAMGLLRLGFDAPTGIRLVITHCLVVWGGDSAAYYLGSRFGRHKMAPRVSPKKSWEGQIGGTLGTIFGVWFCTNVFFPSLGLRAAIGLAVIEAVLAPLGDLIESLFKRDCGVKDSATVIPGHGGFLDRTDSLFFAAPFVAAFFLIVGVAW